MSKQKNKTTSKAKTKAAAAKSPAKTDPDLVPLSQMKKVAAKKEPKKLSCLDAAAQLLKSAGEPMNCKAMIDAMSAKKLWTTDAPTPAATLYSAILREQKTKGKDALFKKTDRGLFTLA